MARIHLPAGKWQIISTRSCVLQTDQSAAGHWPLAADTLLPVVVEDLASNAVYQLNDGDAPTAANRVAGGLAAAMLPAVSAVDAQRNEASSTAHYALARSARLRPIVDEARKLLRWSATSGREVGDEVKDAIVATADAVDRGAATVNDEQRLLKASQALTAKLAPVSAATLDASMQRLPGLSTIFRRNDNFLSNLSGMTFGRFAHAVFFVVVLLVAAVALSYQSIGSAAMGRYKTLTDDIAKLSEDVVKQRAILRDKQAILDEANKGNSGSQAARVAANAVLQATEELELKTAAREDLAAERKGYPKKLRTWLRRESADPAPETEILDNASTTLEQLNRIVLPLLFGLLGSYSYILRSISVDIRAQQFAPHSALHHIARLSLGALAGIAATWLLTADKLGLSNTLPLWTLAFVAGYGTELVFAFMDRIVAAFKG